MPNKDFLDQFSTNNVPDSFKNEELKPVKKKKNLTSILIVVLVIVVLLLIGVVVFLFINRPNIDMPNFVGQKVSDVTSWLKQQEIEASGIVYKEEYSDDYDEKIIIKQSVAQGEKVKKDVKMDFTVSLGPDPNASIIVPDISSMNLDSIKTWIDDNKLRGVKLNYEFSDIDPLDSVISFVFGNGVSETNFVRTSSLTITISKGKQSDQAISVPNFIGKNVSEVETWGSKNKIKVVKKEEFSSTVQKDMVISQSVNVGKKITSKETLTVNVSRGEAIYAPDFSNYSEANIIAWGTKNLVNIEIIRKYSSSVSKDKVIEQSNKGEPVNDGMTVTISLGDINVSSLIGTTLSDYYRWKEEVNSLGAEISESIETINDDYVDPNIIISINNIGVGKTLQIKVSKGKNIYLKSIIEDGNPISWDTLRENPGEYNEDQVRSLCGSDVNKGITCNFVYETSDSVPQRKVIKVSRSDGAKRTDGKPDIGDNMYISQNITLIFTICEKYTGS